MSYDYVIVGAGSAGCVLASRLSAAPEAKVLLLEAGGPDTQQEIHIPVAFSKLFKTEVDWAYETEPQQHMLDRRLFWPRGKVLGGSSSINAMIYIRGHRAIYDRWAELVDPGWGYDALLPYFKRSENFEGGASAIHATGGPLNVTSPRDPNPLSRAFVGAAATALGVARDVDFNREEQEGVGLYDLTQKAGKRHSTVSAFLKPAMSRPNLTIATGAHATSIRLAGRRATGVSYLQDGKETYAEAGEVILCGGAINSPQLLLLSGIGPAADLEALDIPVAVNLPGVGENLQDHLIVLLNYTCPKPVSLASAESLPQLFKYVLFKKGLLTSNVGEAGGFVKTAPGKAFPGPAIPFRPGLLRQSRLRQSGVPRLHPRPHPGRFSRSRGRLWLRSRDPLAPPAIDPLLLRGPGGPGRPGARCRAGAQDRRRPGRSMHYRGREIFPDMGQDLESIRDAVRRTAATLYHPTGTCKMGRRRFWRWSTPSCGCAWCRPPACRRCLDHAGDHQRQHQRADHRDRGKGRGSDPRQVGGFMKVTSGSVPESNRAKVA